MRLLDALLARYRDTGLYNEYMASGAVNVLEQTWGPNKRLLEQPQTTYQACLKQYRQNGVVYAAILARMCLFSEIKFVFQEKENGKLSNLPPRAEILENPWPGGVTGDLLARMIQDVDLAGNSYIWKPEPELLVRLDPQKVSIVSQEQTDSQGRKYRTLVGYWWDPNPTADGKPSDDAEFFTPEEVAHWAPTPDPTVKFRGMSWLTPVLDEINSDQALTQYKLSYLYKAATPNLVLQYKQKLQKETIDALRTRMEARYGGVDNAFKTLILDQGADVKAVGSNLNDMQFVNVQAAGETRILMAAGVPGIVVGAKEGLQAATYSNYALAMRRFAEVTIDPLWRSVCSCLSGTIVNTPTGMRLWYDIRDIPALQQNALEKAQANQVLSAAIAELARFDFDAQSIIDFMATGDVTQLKHKGPFVMATATVPVERPLTEHQGPTPPGSNTPTLQPPKGPSSGPSRLPVSTAQKGPVAGTVAPQGSTTSPGANGKTTVSGSKK